METCRVRPETSKKNKYWIDRDRYYELKHFCLQYPKWRKQCAAIDGLSKAAINDLAVQKNSETSDPTELCVEKREMYRKNMTMIEQAALETDTFLAGYILRGVTEGVSYNYLQTKLDVPCCKDTYYNLYRRFFWLLDRSRE